MKLKNLLASTSLVLLGLVLTGGSARAVSATSGDVILNFRTNDNSVPFNLEVNLGAATQFTTWAANNPGSTFNLNLNGTYYGSSAGLSETDLETVYGASWNSLTNLVWNVAGKSGSANNQTLYVTVPLATAAPNRAAGATQATPANRIGNEYSGFISANATGLLSPQAVKVASGDLNSYTTEIRNGTSFTKDYNYFNSSTETGVVSSGTASLALYQLAPGSGAGTFLGTFNLDSQGNFSFTAAIPEPSTYAMFGIGAFGLLYLHRKRNQARISA